MNSFHSVLFMNFGVFLLHNALRNSANVNRFYILRRSGHSVYKAELNKRAKWHRADKPIYTVIVTSITSKQIFYHPTSTVPKEVVAKSPTTAACYGGWFLKKFQLFLQFFDLVPPRDRAQFEKKPRDTRNPLSDPKIGRTPKNLVSRTFAIHGRSATAEPEPEPALTFLEAEKWMESG